MPGAQSKGAEHGFRAFFIVCREWRLCRRWLSCAGPGDGNCGPKACAPPRRRCGQKTEIHPRGRRTGTVRKTAVAGQAGSRRGHPISHGHARRQIRHRLGHAGTSCPWAPGVSGRSGAGRRRREGDCRGRARASAGHSRHSANIELLYGLPRVRRRPSPGVRTDYRKRATGPTLRMASGRGVMPAHERSF